ncbi:MAG: hypothetical protein QNJ75_01915 [Acidimicrobiia bacterium]|nr:hypothetical protein [Acidimicrobiia bacterium]
MSEIDYEELIKSPLDDEKQTPDTAWSVAVPGAAVGLLLGWLLTLGGGDGAEPASTTAVTTSRPPDAAVVSDFPPGYGELAPDLGAAGTEVVLTDESTIVAFTTAAQRGTDPVEVAWPIGGEWLLESAAGTTIESTRVVNGRFSASAFSVHFPPQGEDTTYVQARLIERWDVEHVTGSVELPFTEEPFSIDEPLSVPVDQSLTLIIPRLDLGSFLGTVEWRTVGANLGTTVQMTIRLFDAEGGIVGSYERFPEVREPSEEGTLEFSWSEPFPIDQEGAVTVSLEYTVGVVTSVPVSLAFDLTEVPVGR